MWGKCPNFFLQGWLKFKITCAWKVWPCSSNFPSRSFSSCSKVNFSFSSLHCINGINMGIDIERNWQSYQLTTAPASFCILETVHHHKIRIYIRPPCDCSLELIHLLQDALVTVWWKTFCNFTQELRSSLTLWCQSKKYIWSEIFSLKLFQCVATHLISKFDRGIISL